jgi:F0F1-type ATP synthase alpha subunit
MVDERTRKTIEHGRRIRAVLTQPQFAPEGLGEQLALLLAVGEGLLDPVPLERVAEFRRRLPAWLQERCPSLLALGDQAALDADLRAQLKAALSALATELVDPPASAS